MNYLRLLSNCLLLFILALLTGCSADINPDNFIADMNEYEGDQVKNYKMYVVGDSYRMEMGTGDNEIILLVDKEVGQATILSVIDKAFTVVNLDNQALVKRDPFLAIEYIKARGEVTSEGSESMNGYDCRKELISMNGNKILTQWFSEELGFPVKVENHMATKKYIELTNISFELADDSLFTIPADYTEILASTAPEVEIPDWVAGIPEAPVWQTPFEYNLRAGEMIRIPIRHETSVWFKAVQIGSVEADVKAIPFQNGRPLQTVENYPNFAQDGVVCVRQSETPWEASEIIIRVFTGAVTVTGRSVAVSQKMLEEGQVVILRVNNEFSIEDFRLVNSSAKEAVISWNFYDEDEPLLADEYGEAVSGQVTLAPYEVVRSSLPAIGNRLHIRSEKGKAMVSIGQWDPTKF